MSLHHDVAVTRAVRADAAAIAAISAPSFGPPWLAETIAQELELAHVRVWVARVAGELVGFVLLGRAADEGEIRLLGVAPAWRRRGVARVLLDHVLATETASGARRIALEVRVGNEPARRLYHHAGFAAVGVRRRYYPDGEDAVVLAIDLLPPVVAAGSCR